MKVESEDDLAQRISVTKKNFGRFFPKLAVRGDQMNIPSMLVLSCNTLEVLRLRHLLLMTLKQATMLRDLYLRQNQLVRKDGSGGHLRSQRRSVTDFTRRPSRDTS